MFTTRIRRTGSSVGKSIITRSTAVLGTVGIIGALAVAAPAAASATTAHATWAQGKFLAGSLAGLNLDTIAGLAPATARNSGTQGTQEVVDPLGVSLLGTQPVDIGAIRVSPDAVIDTQTHGGALSQYARAEKTGLAIGASGSVGEGGAIGPSESNPSNALTLSLDQLIGSSYSSVVADLKLAVRAIAANARGTLQSVEGDYYIDGLTLTFTSPALAEISATITKAVGDADAKLDALAGRNGELAAALNAALVAANPALSIAGDATVSVTLSRNLQAAVAELLAATWGGSGVSFNITTGRVSIDLNKLIGDNLNNLPVNSEVLTSANVARIVSTIASNVTELSDQVLTRVNTALGNAKLDVDVDLNVLTDQAPILGQTCQYQDSRGNILSDVLGKLLGTLICTPTSTALPALKTSAAVDVHGTVSQILNGTAPATASAQVLGVPLALSTERILAPLGQVVKHRIYDAGGIVSGLRGLLDGPLLAQANSCLLGSTGIQALLSNILSIRVNLQETRLSGGGLSVATNTVFTETAMRVAVAKSTRSGGLTTLSLASASVAPTVVSSVPGEPGTTGGPGTPGGPGTTGDPGDPGTVPAGEVGAESVTTGSLAYTGVAIGSAIAALLGLLISGAWLARKGYRRNHPTLVP